VVYDGVEWVIDEDWVIEYFVFEILVVVVLIFDVVIEYICCYLLFYFDVIVIDF